MKKKCKNHGFPHSFIGISGVITVVIALTILLVWILPIRTAKQTTVTANVPTVAPEPYIPEQPVYYSTTMRGNPVGYEIKTWNRKTDAGGTQSLEIISQSCLKIRRGGQVTVLRIREKQAMSKQPTTKNEPRTRWQIKSFETSVQGGGQTQSVRGVLQKKQLNIYENDRFIRTMTVKDNFHGILYLDHLYLEGNLPRPEQTIEIQAVVGSLTADLTVCSEEAAFVTDSSSTKFNKISVFQKNSDSQAASAVPLEIVWNSGDWPNAILELPGLQARNEPVAITDPASAAQFLARFEAIPDDQLFDLNAAMLIPADRPVNSSAPVNQFILPITPNALPSDDYQFLEEEQSAPGHSLVTISAAPVRKTTPQLPTPESREPSPLVNFQDPRVLRLLASQSGFPAGELNSLEQLKAAERFVAIYITEKIYSDALADAASVVDSRRGDCTEHACLLAALLRGRNVPCRMAVGLVYVPQSQSFGFHAWNEAWLPSERRWIPLDAAQQGFDANHIKFAETNFDASSLNAAMTTLYNYMAQIKAIKINGNRSRKRRVRHWKQTRTELDC